MIKKKPKNKTVIIDLKNSNHVEESINNPKNPGVFNDFMMNCGSIKSCHLLLHNTTKEYAEKIINEGFLFGGDDFSKTTDSPSVEEVPLRWFLQQRKQYGDCTTIIQISRELESKYKCFYEQSFTTEILEYNEEDFSNVNPVR